MSHTKRTWIVLAMGLLALGAVAPEAAAEGGSSDPQEPAPSDVTECVVIDPYEPSAEVYTDCLE